MIDAANTVLRAWEESDLPLLQALRNDLTTQIALMARPRPNSIARVRRWIDERSARPDIAFFVVQCRTAGTPCGYVELRDIDPLHGTAALGICIDPGFRKRGYAAEALQALETYGQQVFRLRKIVLEVLASNAPAVAVYGKVGYREVGRLAEHFHHDGLFHDVLIMEKMLTGAGAPNGPEYRG